MNMKLSFWQISHIASWLIIIVLLVKAFVFGLPQIETIKLRELTHQFIMATAKQKISASQKQVEINSFSQALQYEVGRYQSQHHVLLLVKGAVVGGAKDVTPEIKKRIEGDLS